MNTEIILDTKLVGNVQGVFYVPSYQRGYRWGKEEVTRLLEDIYTNGNKTYCLQPVVVRKDGDLGEWNRKYDNPYVLDGTQWELTLEFSNGRRKVCFYGSNKYPWCFDKLTEFFGCYEDDEE